jgi:hypothetical protein
MLIKDHVLGNIQAEKLYKDGKFDSSSPNPLLVIGEQK